MTCTEKVQIKIYIADFITIRLLYNCFRQFTIIEYNSTENAIVINTSYVDWAAVNGYDLMLGKDYIIETEGQGTWKID